MASRGGKKQLRRSISLTAGSYEELKTLATMTDRPMAQVVEQMIHAAAAKCDIHVDPEAARVRANELYQQRAKARADRLAQLQREAFGT